MPKKKDQELIRSVYHLNDSSLVVFYALTATYDWVATSEDEPGAIYRTTRPILELLPTAARWSQFLPKQYPALESWISGKLTEVILQLLQEHGFVQPVQTGKLG